MIPQAARIDAKVTDRRTTVAPDPEADLLSQLQKLAGVAMTVQTQTGGRVSVRVNTSTAKLQYYDGTTWTDL